jgi:hypothetical protein
MQAYTVKDVRETNSINNQVGDCWSLVFNEDGNTMGEGLAGIIDIKSSYLFVAYDHLNIMF